MAIDGAAQGAARAVGLDMTRTGIGLRIEGLSKSYGSRRVLRDVDLEMRAGEFLAIVGRSGCGKSTLLRLIAGLETADAGSLTFDREGSSGSRSAVRMIFQDARLLPWETVLSNVRLGVRPALRVRGLRREREAKARALLGAVGLADRAADWPGRLSGGQRQRVALARGLMSEPGLLLLDEPLGALDALTRLEMQQLIAELWQASGFTAAFVTHDIHEAVALADRVIVLEEGAIVADERIAISRPRANDDRRCVEIAALLLNRILGTTPPSLRSSIPPSNGSELRNGAPHAPLPPGSALRDHTGGNEERVRTS
jgi:sulfonate transport system ATP-binding protein